MIKEVGWGGGCYGRKFPRQDKDSEYNHLKAESMFLDIMYPITQVPIHK